MSTWTKWWKRVGVCILLAFHIGCVPDPGDLIPTPDILEEDRSFVSPPTLQYPIYACASSVVVKGFIPGATLNVHIDGDPSPVASIQSLLSNGQLVQLPSDFVVGQRITAKQVFDGATSDPSNEVQVTSHTEDYPTGLPKPRLSAPCLDCGRAVGIRDAVQGAWVRIFSEARRSGGGFEPEVQIGSTTGGSYAILTEAFQEGARIHAESGLCTDVSPPSEPEIVQSAPASVPPPSLNPVHEGVEIVVVRGSSGDPLLNGATLEVLQEPALTRVGGQATPGGAQQVRINPPASGQPYRATQALCTESAPSDPAPVVPCADQPPARIRPPVPGDLQVEVIESVPGARILIFAGGVEIGDGGAPLVTLKRPLMTGETLIVLQRIGTCDSQEVHEVPVACPFSEDGSACAGDWPAFRQNTFRSGEQPVVSAMADPYQVKRLQVLWRFPQTGSVGPFRASPVVHGNRVFVGSGDGYLYALDATTGAQLWQYPDPSDDPLTSQFTSNPSSRGIAASAMIATTREQGDVVIIAAPDQSIGAGLGSGRIFALRVVDGSEVWKSPELARLTGLNRGSTTELHEQFGYSAPLVLGDRVYAGIANHGDNPIQMGRLVSVDLDTGTPISGFTFEASGTRGGGIWSSVAGGLEGGDLYVTTGNTKCWNAPPGDPGPVCQPEPSPNHGLSLLRLDAGSGAISWKLQPVGYAKDGDPDWATGARLLASSCGPVAISTMKDGWSYAVDATAGSPPSPDVRWQFPPTGFPFPLTPSDPTSHGDSRYLVPGAAWDDVFFSMTGGRAVTYDVNEGFGRLHALNVCAGDSNRVRWIADIPGASIGDWYQLGPPSVTRGIVFIGTASGNLVALADPSAWPVTQGSRCTRTDVPADDCVSNGYRLVPMPAVLSNVSLGAGRILTEPVIAGGRVFVATEGGVVFMLGPG